MTTTDGLTQAFGYWENEEQMVHQTPTEMVKEYASVSGQQPNARLYVDLIDEEFGEWSYENMLYLNHSDLYDDAYQPHLEIKELADLLYVIYGYANARGWDVEEALRRVHGNNMGRMLQPDGTIKRRADGKIEKNKEYPKVNLGDLVK